MRKITIHILLFLFAFMTVKAQEESPVVLSGDRTIIYIDRLPLRGDETLMDVLLMYPDQVVQGFEDLIDEYQLRMENVPLSCDIRQFLTSTPAKACTKIQICENPGVAKGKTGLDGVIDLSMRPNTDGVHGLVQLEAATSTNVAPMLKINYGYADSAGYYADVYAHTGLNMDYPRNNFEMEQYTDVLFRQRFGAKDKLLLYLRQEYDCTNTFSAQQKYLARARYFHTFNDLGTELLVLAGYQYDIDRTNYTTNHLQCRNRTRSGTQLYTLELNTPLPFLPGMHLLTGWEMDRTNIRYHLTQDMVVPPTPFDATDYYTVMNNDLYLQLDYTLGPVKLSLGDRVSFYRYDMQAHNGNTSRNTIRNFIMASVAATLAPGHQLQAGYYRRFINPYYLLALPTLYPYSDGKTWSTTDSLINEQKADVVRLAYAFSRKNVTANLGSEYTRLLDENTHIIQVNIAASWIHPWILLSGAAHFNHRISAEGPVSYGSIRLSPTLRLPQQWRIAPQFIWYSLNAPYREVNGAAVYGLLTVEKRIEDCIDLSLSWHDPFNSSQSAVVFAAKILF